MSVLKICCQQPPGIKMVHRTEILPSYGKIEKNILNSVHIMSSAGRIRCAISNVHCGLLVIISTCIRPLEKANRIS